MVMPSPCLPNDSSMCYLCYIHVYVMFVEFFNTNSQLIIRVKKGVLYVVDEKIYWEFS